MDPSPSDASAFAGAAAYYAAYRVPYPQPLLDTIIAAFHLDGRGRLLDLGCGPGTVALRLSDTFEDVVGVDPDAEMIAEAKRRANATGITNVRWLTMRAEDVGTELAPVRLIVLGSSFHWMDQAHVLEICRPLLSGDGGIAIFGMPSFWNGAAAWQHEVIRIVQQHLGVERRAGSSTFRDPERRYEAYLEEAGFSSVTRSEIRFDHTWTVDSIIGHLYSTSFAARPLFGDGIDAFERDIRALLGKMSSAGEFREDIVAELLVARVNRAHG